MHNTWKLWCSGLKMIIQITMIMREIPVFFVFFCIIVSWLKTFLLSAIQNKHKQNEHSKTIKQTYLAIKIIYHTVILLPVITQTILLVKKKSFKIYNVDFTSHKTWSFSDPSSFISFSEIIDSIDIDMNDWFHAKPHIFNRHKTYIEPSCNAQHTNTVLVRSV